jgi:ADP-heptose:LPS heptosyltransferase
MTEMKRSDARAPLDFSALREIAVFRALQLGDLLCVVPALRALRAAAPQARFTLVGLPWAESFVQRFHCYLDELLVFPGFPGLPESAPQLEKLPEFFSNAQARSFDLAIQLHGSGGLSNPLMVALGAKRNAGFHAEGQYCPEPALFTQWVGQEHEALRYVRLMEFLGAPSQGTHLEFPLADEDYHSLSAAWPEWPQSDDYVCIHPGARLPSRRWPPERFAYVADGLADNGLGIVLTGSDSERDIIDAVRGAMRAPSLDLSGRTTLGGLAAVAARARLVVCNDTGMSHVAAGVGTPSVVVSSGADPHRWAPLNAARHRFLYADAPCRPCAHVVCPIGHPCALGVDAGKVLEEALALCAAGTYEERGDASPRQASVRPPSTARQATLQGN